MTARARETEKVSHEIINESLNSPFGALIDISEVESDNRQSIAMML